MTDLLELKIPDIGDFADVEVIEVLISEGDMLIKDQDIITLESDKAAMEIPAEHAGRVEELKIKVGDKVSRGTVIAMITGSNNAVATIPGSRFESTELKPKNKPDWETPQPEASTTDVVYSQAGGISHASPSVRRFARKLGVDLAKVSGTGHKCRVRKEDVQNFVKSSLQGSSGIPVAGASAGGAIPAVPLVDFANFGDTTTKELTRVKKISGKHLHACWLNVPHVTQFGEADITELEQFRKDNKEMASKQGVNLTPLVFIMKTVVSALQKFPEFNSSLSEDKEHLILKDYHNIGVAVDTVDGLMVPVIKDVGNKGFLELARELGDISSRTRDGRLTTKDLQGGTFSISSLGGIGGSFFTPIVNAPEVAILGIGRHQFKPIWNGNDFEPRLMLPLSVSYDHRIVDGATGARFITYLSQMLSDIRKGLL